MSLLREGLPVPRVCLLCIECVLMNARPVLCLGATSTALLLLLLLLLLFETEPQVAQAGLELSK